MLHELATEKRFREALHGQTVGELFATLDEIQSLTLPPISETGIQVQIDEARAGATRPAPMLESSRSAHRRGARIRCNRSSSRWNT